MTDLSALDDLLASRGWAIVTDHCRRELTAAARHLASPRPLTTQEIDFQRGALWALQTFTDFPAAIRQSIETDLLFQRSASAEQE